MNEPLENEGELVPVPKPPEPLEPAAPGHQSSTQARIDAVANLTMEVYSRASTLALTEEERRALLADFPDEAFRPGAAGKDNLIYIEHAFLRDRLNEVFGPGQWALIPRTRWTEDFRTGRGVPGVRVYVEAMLCIRGCFVGEAVGDMSYYPNNDSQNFGDAVEGAKTAALRRCVKELGVGLQAWKKGWQDGWWQRHYKKPVPAQPAPAPAQPSQDYSRMVHDNFLIQIAKAPTLTALAEIGAAIAKAKLTEHHKESLRKLFKEKKDSFPVSVAEDKFPGPGKPDAVPAKHVPSQINRIETIEAQLKSMGFSGEAFSALYRDHGILGNKTLSEELSYDAAQKLIVKMENIMQEWESQVAGI